jgi:hypothetical protein
MTANIIKKLRKTSRFTLIGIGLLAACVLATARSTQEISPGSSGSTASLPTDSSGSSAAPTPTVDLSLSNIPFVPLLPRDGIAPVYNPEFVSADVSPLHEDELIMGVAIEGEAKAYPVTVLRFREMVNDELAGLPILVTW